MTPVDRFAAFVDRRGPVQCWPWLGQTSNGYGRFWTGERSVAAHRFAFEQDRGPVPSGLVLDHLCRNGLYT